MIIKVCGLKYAENLLEVSQLNIDMVGYNFYPSSARYVDQALPEINQHIQKVGVFVNATSAYIQEKVAQYQLDLIQLHGDESLDFCREISSTLKPVIKVFRVDKDFDYGQIKDYAFCKYLLFDTATKDYGGSGHKFDWTDLLQQNIETPFLLAGGIGLEDVENLKSCNHPSFAGIDINSKFELSPGLKDPTMIADFIRQMR
jgi:phosphoribosylanthranilate isomerase